MAKITDEMKQFVKGKVAFVATVSPGGLPDVGPKGSLFVLDDEHLIYYELTGRHHYENLKNNSKIAVSVVDVEKIAGYTFQGSAELITSGPLFDKASQWSQKAGFVPPKAVVKIKVDSVHEMGKGLKK
ncbi:MAG: pyridoxamine 5'-phosphate oxidase family protein [Chloroflexi bacterium]|nr:pyridoxamine 5'-phosphate oxidase family protein [Chloroflexota bacterium]